ncbi:hypothetical protein PACILC2_26350 [Paenibacillus cisolokensis]|uniref:Radical SAM core domain-containing protein n=1 Tax=Paenibacillus cisolokensis TaxID=1658519 RepID=A0ABQ4N781_9BACL|nr:hypothetical protein PACILC2_26350 [Paenibacillus cisolokensis]
MQVHIQASETSFERSLSHIVALFFEDAKTTFSAGPDDGADLLVLLSAEERESGAAAAAELTDRRDGSRLSSRNERPVPAGASEEFRRRQLKQAMSHALLDVLQRHTGIIQPWGILTGVRPTKLLHERVRRGVPMEQARRELAEDYLISERKIGLMEQIVERQLTALPDLYHLRREVSIYIGVPFCPTKCAYCTFPAYDINGRQGSVNGFLDGLHYEMREIGQWLRRHNVGITTVYYGGGTPTSITAEEMDAMYAAMYEYFPGMDRVREVTVEAGRPDTITPEKLAVLQNGASTESASTRNRIFRRRSI